MSWRWSLLLQTTKSLCWVLESLSFNFVASRNRTFYENMAPTGSIEIQQKYKKTAFLDCKNPAEKSYNDKKKQISEWKNAKWVLNYPLYAEYKFQNIWNTLLDGQLFGIRTSIAAWKGVTDQFQFSELLQFASAQIHHNDDKNFFIDSKNPVLIVSCNQRKPY